MEHDSSMSSGFKVREDSMTSRMHSSLIVDNA